ncbi:uncharacterized protein LOC120679773 [Panicum virgatum]|uniref:F-box domain-containing protein n=1 Tax=Panicum virgatum TaxID=38727 RepID=A0A8T0XCD1_PANVG|nr:uncharacterized protein LOC120679773 [Panicum virgatum]KAG2656797.1 hypothetical protein PVAP13_1KG105800 [Panicum virgatum]
MADAGGEAGVGGKGEEPGREIPDEITGEILLRLPSRSALARAAAASGGFRALVSSPRFLRRHRALHRDPGALLGVFTFSLSRDGTGFHPAEPPHPAAAAARAVAAAADFSFGFLPADPSAADGAGDEGWMVRDYRDGRFLLDRAASGTERGTVFTELAVCDPLYRRYVLLPPIPEDLADTVGDVLSVFGGRRACEPFLAPAEPCEPDAERPPFTVFWTARCQRKLAAFAFSSRDGRWRALPSPDCFIWRRHRSPFSCPMHTVWNRRHYAHGRFYWVDCLTNRWLVLDARAMELALAIIPSPAGYWEEHVAVVEAPDGKVGVFAHDFHHPGGKADLHYYTIAQDADSPQWQLEKTIPLPWPAACHQPFCVRGTANGCLILEVSEEKPAFMARYCVRDAEMFKIDVKSFQLEKICQARCAGGAAGQCCWPYFGFPPSLALPTV